MEVRNYNTLTFLRHYFHIPASQKIAWALIVETIAGREEIRLGVLFSRHPHLYLDVAMRRFFTESTLFNGAASRRVFPAQRLMSKYALKEECNDENEERMYSCQMDAKSRFFFYEKVFASIIIKLSGALILREKRGKNIALTAYGSIEQVQFAYETYLFLKKALKDAYDKEKQNEENLDYYSFAAGLASMLYEKIKKCEEQSDARALAISYRDNRRMFENIFTSSKITGRRTRAMFQSREAYEKGEIASKGINIPQKETHPYIRKIEDKREK